MTIDSTLEFEKRRNIPIKYDRNLMQTTIKAMKRVHAIKAKRERVFYKNRVMEKRQKDLQLSIDQLQKDIDLIDTPELKQLAKEHASKHAEPVQKDVEMA